MPQLDVPVETSSTVHVLPPSSLLLDLSGAFDVALYFLVLLNFKPTTSISEILPSREFQQVSDDLD